MTAITKRFLARLETYEGPPFTISHMADLLGVNYSEMRNSINYAVKRGLVRQTHRSGQRQKLYMRVRWHTLKANGAKKTPAASKAYVFPGSDGSQETV